MLRSLYGKIAACKAAIYAVSTGTCAENTDVYAENATAYAVCTEKWQYAR